MEILTELQSKAFCKKKLTNKTWKKREVNVLDKQMQKFNIYPVANFTACKSTFSNRNFPVSYV